ncbi:MAG TPA: SDR family oxidoreductase [Acidimicrobiia bacterium]|jgi:3-oxoacyl-[acyl-carrier protein] reductase
MDLGIAGKRAIVAASTSGLGLATARALAREGARVAICGRDLQRTREAAGEIGDNTIAFACDLTVEGAPERFVRDARQDLGGCDILVANAGGPPPGTFATTDIDGYRAAFELNCLASVAMCQVAIPYMRENKWGRVVAITSIGAKQPIGGLMASSVARAALTSFLKITAREVAHDGITVNNVCPGLHTTARLTNLHADNGLDALAAAIPAGKLGDPADFGRVVAFLCSEAANYVNGVSLLVDGAAYEGLL